MKNLSILLASMFLLVGCAESIALLGSVPGATNGKIIQSSLNSVVSYGIKKQTGRTPMEHALAYAEKNNPNKKKEKCISFIEKTNSEACMIAKKQITLVRSSLTKKISSTQNHTKERAQEVIGRSIKEKSEVINLDKPKKTTREFFIALRTKIKEYDERWLDRIEKSKTRHSYQ